MNKRQSKKQELQTQVDDLQIRTEALQEASSSNSSLINFYDWRLNQSIKRANENFETISSDFTIEEGKVDRILKAQENILPQVTSNRRAILDVQRQLKYVNFNSIIHSIAIFALAAAIVFISIRVMS